MHLSRSKHALKQRFLVKWRTQSRKRFNYDLHNIFGFYASVGLLIISLIGLIGLMLVVFIFGGGVAPKRKNQNLKNTNRYSG
ncbi:MAG: PepSY domain-containing protein [Bacteroidia bacterium]|nr:PepSY domain-containing protein [Bacteroidia bacterium]